MKKSEKMENIVKSVWGRKIIVDAKENLRVFILPEDLENATRKDPACCIFAQACKRSFHATKVLFFRTVAYVELPFQDGETRIERFILPKPMRDLIADFDKGRTDIPSAGFLLKSPTVAQSLDAERTRSKEQRERDQLLGKRRMKKGNGGNRSNPDPKEFAFQVRNGTGAVHFKQMRDDEDEHSHE